MKKRNLFIDFCKGILILLVLLGHSIQYARGKAYLSSLAFYNDWAFKLIYGFHMSCFMVIGGYLFYFAIELKSVWDVILGKIRTLIVPIFSFALIVWLLQIHADYSFVDQIRNYLSCTRFTLWFLWALFYCSMGVLLVNKIANDNLIVYLVLIIGSFLTPDKWFFELYKFMFPCFLFGYYANKNKWVETFKKNIKIIACVTVVLYVLAMFAYYNVDTYVYMSGSYILSKGMVNWHQLFINVYRTLVGICGSVAFVSLMFLVYNALKDNNRLVKHLTTLGAMTMGIYCFQNYFWQLYDGYVPWFVEPAIVNQLFTFAVSLAVSYTLTWLVSRVKVLNLLFLGGR